MCLDKNTYLYSGFRILTDNTDRGLLSCRHLRQYLPDGEIQQRQVEGATGAAIYGKAFIRRFVS